MSETTKLQPYKYSLRSTAIAPRQTPNSYLCNSKFYVMPVPPEDAISIENLYLHLKVRFNTGVAAGSRKIMKIGVANERPSFAEDIPSRLRTYDVNLSADANRYIDTTIDLSALLDHDAVGYKSYFDFEDPAKKYTYVYFELPSELINTSNIGDLVICRMDALYTTLGIR